MKTERIQVGKLALSRQCYAKLGNWLRHGTTREEAHAALLNALHDQQEYMHTRVTLVGPKAVFVLRYADGWQYDLIHIDVVGKDCPSTCMLGQCTKSGAIEAMTSHYEQYHADPPQ